MIGHFPSLNESVRTYSKGGWYLWQDGKNSKIKYVAAHDVELFITSASIAMNAIGICSTRIGRTIKKDFRAL